MKSVFFLVLLVAAVVAQGTYIYDPKRALSAKELHSEIYAATLYSDLYAPCEETSIDTLAEQIFDDLNRLLQRIRRWHGTHPGQVYDAPHVITCDLGYIVDRLQKEVAGKDTHSDPPPLIFEVKIPEGEFLQIPEEYL